MPIRLVRLLAEGRQSTERRDRQFVRLFCHGGLDPRSSRTRVDDRPLHRAAAQACACVRDTTAAPATRGQCGKTPCGSSVAPIEQLDPADLTPAPDPGDALHHLFGALKLELIQI
jgi:hypothetical protein